MLIRLHLPFELFDFCTVTSPFPLDPLEAKMEKIWFNVQRLVVTGSDTSQAIMRPTEVCPVARGLTSQKVDRKMELNLSLWGKKNISPFSFRSNPYYYRVLRFHSNLLLLFPFKGVRFLGVTGLVIPLENSFHIEGKNASVKQMKGSFNRKVFFCFFFFFPVHLDVL